MNLYPYGAMNTGRIIHESADLLFEHSLFNGHPRFWGYITSSAAPIGVLAEMLASSVNANVGAFTLSPMATEIELQTVKWLAELVGYNPTCGGLFVSGGNMANFTGLLAARNHQIKRNIRQVGLPAEFITPPELPRGVYLPSHSQPHERRSYTIYCSHETHTWVYKAADLFGFGTNAIRLVACNRNQQMDVTALHKQIRNDTKSGHVPFMVIGNAGTVATGAVDPLDEIARICRQENLWFHVDGAYGAPAAALPEQNDVFKGLDQADSIAIDPHKWLYSPIEAGCVLIKDRQQLQDVFSFNPDYYNFNGEGGEKPINFHELGMQNSRGFNALKVWLSFKQVGKNGFIELIRNDIDLAKLLFQLLNRTPCVEAVSQNLSITSFRYVPEIIPVPDAQANEYLNTLNEKLLNRLQKGGEVFLSNAIIEGRYCLRVCVVNFRTTYSDLEALVEIVLREGKELNKSLSSQG